MSRLPIPSRRSLIGEHSATDAKAVSHDARKLRVGVLLLTTVTSAVLADRSTATETPNALPVLADAPQERSRVDDFASQRTIGRRLAVHEPIYFIAGSTAPEAKFQLSFKYRLATLPSSARGNASQTLQFAYTQRSLWDIGSRSSPFYDTSYMPELMYQWVATTTENSSNGVSWLGFHSGLRHESNGQADDASRSLNQLFLRPAFTIGSSDSWHVLLAPEAYAYVGGLDENPDLDRYRGNFALRAGVAHGDRESLMLNWIPGRNFSRGSWQFDLSIPVHIESIGFATYLQIQYFDGYGESLLSYKENSSALRIGFAVVR